jgi:hypothetical protein
VADCAVLLEQHFLAGWRWARLGCGAVGGYQNDCRRKTGKKELFRWPG